MSIKKIIFDSSLWTLTLILVASLLTPANFNQKNFTTHFQFIATVLLVTMLLMTALATLAHKLKWQTMGAGLFGAQKIKQKHKIHLALLFLATLWISLQATEASWQELLNQDGLNGAVRLWQGLSHPNMALIPKAIGQAISTVLIAFLATTLAIPIAFLLAFFSAKNIMTGKFGLLIYSALRLFLNVTRSVEPLIWALIFTVWVGVGPFAGMLALMIHSIASLTKYYSEIIEGVDEGPIDGLRSTGANPIQVVWYAIVPQIVLPYVAMTIYRWDTNVRMATVIGLVGGGGIGTLLIQYQGQAMWPEVGAIILVIAVIVWLMDTASAYLREALK